MKTNRFIQYLFILPMIPLFSVLSIQSQKSTPLVQVEAQTCDVATLPTFLKIVPSLKWVTFDGNYFIDLQDVQEAILSDENYFRSEQNVTIEQFLSQNNYFISLDTTELSIDKTVYIFEIQNEEIGYISADQEKIYAQINAYLDNDFLLRNTTYIENDSLGLFFSQSPINKDYYYAYSDKFDMSAFSGCYVSAITQQTTLFNYQSMIQDDAAPFYPLESGYIYNVEIKTSAFSSALRTFSVYVLSSAIVPNFSIEQTNLLSITNSDLTFTKKVSLSISLSVPEALVSIRDVNDFSDEGRFVHYSNISAIQQTPLTLEIPENKKILLSIFYYDFLKSNSFIKTSFYIYSSNRNNESVNDIFELPTLAFTDLSEANQTIYENSLFDYYKNDRERIFTIFVNQRPNGQTKNGGIMFKSLMIKRNNQVLDHDDENKLITLGNNAYIFNLTGNYTFSFRYNNRALREFSKSVIFAPINPTVTFTYEGKPDVNQNSELIIKPLMPSVQNYIHSARVFVTLNHISNTNSTRTPINLTIRNRQNEERTVLSTIEPEVPLEPLIQSLSSNFLQYNNESFDIEIFDKNNNNTLRFPVLISTIFEGIQFSTDLDLNQTIRNQGIDVCDVISLQAQIELSCPSDTNEEGGFLTQTVFDHTEHHYFITTEKTASIQLQYSLANQEGLTRIIQDSSNVFLSVNDEVWVYRFTLPSGTDYGHILSLNYTIRDVFENEFQFTINVRPLGTTLNLFSNLAIFGLIGISVLLPILGIVFVVMAKKWKKA